MFSPTYQDFFPQSWQLWFLTPQQCFCFCCASLAEISSKECHEASVRGPWISDSGNTARGFNGCDRQSKRCPILFDIHRPKRTGEARNYRSLSSPLWCLACLVPSDLNACFYSIAFSVTCYDVRRFHFKALAGFFYICAWSNHGTVLGKGLQGRPRNHNCKDSQTLPGGPWPGDALCVSQSRAGRSCSWDMKCWLFLYY